MTKNDKADLLIYFPRSSIFQMLFISNINILRLWVAVWKLETFSGGIEMWHWTKMG